MDKVSEVLDKLIKLPIGGEIKINKAKHSLLTLLIERLGDEMLLIDSPEGLRHDSIVNKCISAVKEVFDGKCSKCGGNGWTVEHDPGVYSHDGDGNCLDYCPIQVQCEYCQGTGERLT